MLMHQSRSTPVRVIGTALVIAAASLLATVASAKEHGAVSSVVSYGDLDLTQSADAQRLYARLQYASHKVCSSYESRELRMQSLYAKCYATALDQAVGKVNDAKLTALHAAAEPRIRLARRS